MHSLTNCVFDKLEDQDEHVCMVYHSAHYSDSDRNTTSFDSVSWDTSTYIRNLPNLKLSNWIE